MVDQTPQVQKQPVPWFNREPVAIMFVIQSGLALAMGFGFDIDSTQMALILTFSGAVLGLLTRQVVTPYVPVGTTPLVDDPARTPNVATPPTPPNP